MLIRDIRWAVIPRGLRRCREWWNEASLSLHVLVAVATPGMAEAFVAYAAGQGNTVVAGILCARAIGGARQWAAGIGALVPVQIPRRLA